MAEAGQDQKRSQRFDLVFSAKFRPIASTGQYAPSDEKDAQEKDELRYHVGCIASLLVPSGGDCVLKKGPDLLSSTNPGGFKTGDQDRIVKGIAEWNENPVVFRWSHFKLGLK